MNLPQRVIAARVCAAIVLMTIVPPFDVNPPGGAEHNAGYGLLWSMPEAPIGIAAYVNLL